MTTATVHGKSRQVRTVVFEICEETHRDRQTETMIAIPRIHPIQNPGLRQPALYVDDKVVCS